MAEEYYTLSDIIRAVDKITCFSSWPKGKKYLVQDELKNPSIEVNQTVDYSFIEVKLYEELNKEDSFIHMSRSFFYSEDNKMLSKLPANGYVLFSVYFAGNIVAKDFAPKCSNESLGTKDTKIETTFILQDRKNVETSFGEATRFSGKDLSNHKISFFSSNAEILDKITEIGRTFAISGTIKNFDKNRSTTYLNRVKMIENLKDVPLIDIEK